MVDFVLKTKGKMQVAERAHLRAGFRSAFESHGLQTRARMPVGTNKEQRAWTVV